MTLLQAQGQAGQSGGGLTMLLMLALIFVVMWLFMIRPQQKRQKELNAFRDSLKKGDKVVTVGGIYGEIAEICPDNKTVFLRVDGDTKIRVDKQGLVKDYTAQQ